VIDHTGIGVVDVAKSAVFYDAALGALGLRRCEMLPPGDGKQSSAAAEPTTSSGYDLCHGIGDRSSR